MRPLLGSRLFLILSLVAALPLRAAPAAVPGWLRAAAAVPTPAHAAEAPVVVLLDETVATVAPDGAEVTERRCALRIINRSGRASAVGILPSYLDKEDKVELTAAWVLRDGKPVAPADKRQWLDIAAAGAGTIVSDNRARVVSYADFVLDGDVFGFETRVAGRLLFPQEIAVWGGSFPVVRRSFAIALPAGWSLRAVLDGPQAAAVAATRSGQRWSWELCDRPYRADEPAQPANARDDARLFIDLLPAGDARAAAWPRFDSWAEVAAWVRPLQDPQCDTDAALAAKVRELTVDCPDALAKMRALSRHVQRLRYVGVAQGLNKGFGYRPRKATEVNAKGWGDCKDKGNLLRAMLREIGVASYLVHAHTEAGRWLHEGWPSPKQFNHAIVAIRADPALALPATTEVPGLGQCLFFDATDPDTLLGDLPWPLQGAKVHVNAPGSAALTTLPVLPTETHHLMERRVSLRLDAAGTVVGDCSYGGPGRVGSIYRARIRVKTAKDLRTMVTERINSTVRGAILEEVTTTDDPLTGECRIGCRFAAARFAQMMPGGLAVVRLDVLSRDALPTFPAAERKLPVELQPILQRDEVVLALPERCAVEELPARVELQSTYGRYESSYETKGATVVARRVLRLEECIVPVGEYAALRKFLQEVAKADRSAVVLRLGAPPAAQ